MDYWYLLTLVFTFGAAVYMLQSARRQRRLPAWIIALGFVMLASSTALQIVLHFEFQVWVARGFYWLRGMLVLAWLGHGLAWLTFPNQRTWRYASWALLAASLVTLVLVAFTQVTEAQGWFDPSTPIYGQIGDLLATNRPTRWGGMALNLYGVLALTGAAGYAVFTERPHGWHLGGCAIASLLAAVWLVASLYWPATHAGFFFYLAEFCTPLLLLWGIVGIHPNQEATK